MGAGPGGQPGYKRINRFKAWGYAGLGDRSRAPHTHPLEWALDDRLDGALLAHFGYQVNCYFPGAFQSIDEEGSDYGSLY